MRTPRRYRTLLLTTMLASAPLTAALASYEDANYDIVPGVPILLDGSWFIFQRDGATISNTFVIGGNTWIFERAVSVTPPFPYRTESDSYYTVKPSKIDTNGYTETISGDITNGGPTVYTGGGTLILTGAVSNRGNGYTACVTNVPIGSLNVFCQIISTPPNTIDSPTTVQIGNGGTTGSLTYSILNNGTLAFNRSDTYTYGGDISGTGSVAQIGTGTTILTGNNTYTGGTTISAGTLQLGNGGASGWIAGDVADNGTLAFNRPDVVTFGGVISGTGGVSQIGSGTLVLTGANTYSGATTISSGSLQIGNGGATGAIVGNVVDNARLVFNRVDTFVFGGAISGTGTLEQAGPGTLILTGANTLSGTTTISAGTLQVGNGGATGSIAGNIVDNASLAFNRGGIATVPGVVSGTGTLTQHGTGTLVLNGVNTYTGLTTVATGTLLVGDDAHPSARIAGNVVVNQGAALGGHGTIGGTVTNSDGTVMPGGSIGTLTVSSFTQGPAGTLTIEVGPSGASSLVVTGAASLDGTLNFLFAPGTYNVQRLRVFSAGSVTGHFAAVTSNDVAAGAVYGLNFGPTSIDAIFQPASSGQIYGDLVAKSVDDAHSLSLMVLDHDGSGACQAKCPAITVWASGFGGAGSSDSDNSRSDGYWTRWAGLMLGADYHFAADTRVGVAFSYSQSSMGIAGGDSKALGNSYAVALNGAIPIAFGRMGANLFYLSNAVTSRRQLGALGSVEGRPDIHAAGGALQFEVPLKGGDVVPFTTLSFAKVMRAATVESGVDGADLDVRARTYSSLRWYLGLRLQHDFAWGSSSALRPLAEVGLRQELNTTDYAATIRVAGMDGNEFIAPYAKPAPSAFTAAVGLDVRCNDMLTLSLKVDGWMNRRERAGIAGLRGRIAF